MYWNESNNVECIVNYILPPGKNKLYKKNFFPLIKATADYW